MDDTSSASDTASAWSRFAKWGAAIAGTVLAAIAITALSPAGDWLKEIVFPTSATVSGTIQMNQSGLSGAAILVDDDPKGESASDGSFLLRDVDRGDHSLTVTALGARPHTSSFSISQGSDAVELEPIVLSPSVQLAVDIGTQFQPDDLAVIYDLAIWIDEDDDVAALTERVTYRLTFQSAVMIVARPTPKLCATLTAQVALPEVPRGAVEATVEFDDGRSLRLTAPELQAVPNSQRPADCQATSDNQDPTTTTTTTPGGGSTTSHETDASRVTVPDLDGAAHDDATALLREGGFVIESVTEVSKDVPAEHIIRTEPPGGTEVNRGTRVTLFVSSGPGAESVVVPKVAGLDQVQATAQLRQAGFATEVVQEASAEIDAGRVVRTDPTGGTTVPKGSTVTIVVSSGPAVPNVVGQQRTAAAEVIQKAGFKVAVTDASGDGAPGMVIRTSPPPGTVAPKGSTVTLFVSVPPPTSS